METSPSFKTFLSALMAILISFTLIGSAGAANLAQAQPPQSTPPQIEVISPYYSIEHLTTADGTQITGSIISGPPHPLPEFQAERAASMTTIAPEGSLANFPSYSWVFGCSAVSGAMIAAWYDRGSYPNMYTGPTNGGVMPLTDTSWSTWSDGSDTDPNTYPNNPLVASHNGVDGRTIKGSIEDYWVSNNSNALDPYLTGGWSEHAWGDAIGDYMKTSQSIYNNTDGSTTFYTWITNPGPLTCANMETNNIDHLDGTYGRKLFYEARGYTVTDCYNQKTDNNGGGFTLASYKAEIDAGHPVMLNLEGHTVVGFGYDGSTIYIRDTWDNNPANVYTMPWGGSYEGMPLLSVSVVKANANITPPSPPTGISASDGAYTDRIRVSWGGSGNFEYKIYLPLILNGGLGSTPEAPFFEVYRNSTNSTIGAIKLADHHAASPYDDTSAVTGTTYYYWVKACNSAGCSGFSASDSGYREVTPPIMTPGAFDKRSPENGYDRTTMSPVLTWNTSVNATKYEYCYDTTNDGTCSNWTSAGTNTYVGLSDLQAGTTYYWQVRSWNGTYGPTYANGSANAYWSFTTLTTGVWIMHNCTLYGSGSGSYVYFVCEIYNNTNTGVKNFSIDVDFYDVSGNWIGTGYSSVELSIIHPQETACSWGMFDIVPTYIHYKGSYYETSDRRPSLSISNYSGYPGSYAYETLGIITNNSASTVNDVKGIASLYIDSGLVIGCDSGYINSDPPNLAPGQQRSFDISTWLPDPYAITRYKLQADGWIGSLNSLEDMTGEKLPALGGGKTMRLMDRSTLFQVGPQK